MDGTNDAILRGVEDGCPSCPSPALQAFLDRRHMLPLLRRFSARPVLRFHELRAELRCSPNTLAARLRELVHAGILERRAYPGVPPRAEYALTAGGEALARGVLGFGAAEPHAQPGTARSRRAGPGPAKKVRL